MPDEPIPLRSVVRETFGDICIRRQQKGEPRESSPPSSMLSAPERSASRSISGSDPTLETSAIEAASLGFMARALVQTTLPHREPLGSCYTRIDGDLTVSITALDGTRLPYGSYPRLILIWITTEAVRTGKRELELGRSLSHFMRQLGLQSSGGHWGTIPRFRDQMQRLLGAAISTRWSGRNDERCHLSGDNLLLADSFDLWWNPQRLPASVKLPPSSLILSQRFFDQITAAPVPLDLRAIRALKRSPLALDLYAWTTRRVSYLHRPSLISWTALRSSFGAGYADTPQGRSRFRAHAIDALRRVLQVYPQLRFEPNERGLLLSPSSTHVPKLAK